MKKLSIVTALLVGAFGLNGCGGGGNSNLADFNLSNMEISSDPTAQPQCG